MDTVLFFVYSNKYICSDRIEGARRYAEKVGWNIQVVESNNTGDVLDMKGLVDFWKPIGVIAECGGGLSESVHRTLERLPIVYLDEDPCRKNGKALYVNSDSSLVGEIAAKELLALNLPHYAFAGWFKPRFWSEERGKAFADAIKLNGCDCRVFAHPGRADGSHRQKLLRAWLKSLPKPCGIFAANDPVAEEILTIAASAGISVPEELSVIGVDDDHVICERTRPTLTSIKLDFVQGGYICAEMLHRRLRNPQFKSAEAKFGPVFVTRRQSTRRSAQTDRRVARAVEFIRLNACDGIGTTEVAREMGLSRRMAEIAFVRHVGHTIRDEILSARMERVERMLRDPGRDVAAIASFCGWSSGSALRRLFKKLHNGQTMREWRMGALCPERTATVPAKR